jgi:hypothetical protein
MNDERLREAYERGLPVGNDAPTLDDVQAERLRLLVEREGSEGERLRTLDMMLSTAEGRRELDIAWAAARAAPITLVAPVGLVAAPRATHFAWRPIARAERYQLVVVDTTGAELYAIETRDTALALPDSVRLAPGRTYLWWVQATLADHSTVTAVTQRLVVAPR